MSDDSEGEETPRPTPEEQIRRSRSSSSWDAISRPPWTLSDDAGPINLLNVAMPAADNKLYHEEALRNVLGVTVVLSVVVAFLNRLQLNFAWSVVAVGVAAFSIRTRVETLREAFHADMERRRGEGNIGSAESVEWLNSFIRVQWPLIDPQLFQTLTDLCAPTRLLFGGPA